jgi:hypothetical protein
VQKIYKILKIYIDNTYSMENRPFNSQETQLKALSAGMV